MYKEVAFDPCCLVDFHYYGLLKTEFGFEKGRYVSAPVKLWIREAVQAVKNSNMAPIKRKSVVNFLNRLQRAKNNSIFLLSVDRSVATKQQDYLNWESWVKHQQALRRFCIVLSEKNDGTYTNYEQILEGSEAWEIAPTLWIDKTEKDILEAISSLLYTGKELVIADPYFRLSGNNLLKAILRKATASGVQKLTLATSMDCKDLSGVYEKEYQNSRSKLTSFSYIRIPNGFLHDRYMFTERAAIKAGQGFAVAPEKGLQSDHLSISLCGLQELQDTKERIEKFSLQSAENSAVLV